MTAASTKTNSTTATTPRSIRKSVAAGGTRLARTAASAGLVLLCAACGATSSNDQRDVDIARAAEEAQETVDNYAVVRERAPGARASAVPKVRSATPAPRPSAVSTTVTEARYACAGMDDIGIRFDNRTESAMLRLPAQDGVRLTLNRGTDAPFYAGGGYEFHGEGREATLVRPNAGSVTCTAVS